MIVQMDNVDDSFDYVGVLTQALKSTTKDDSVRLSTSTDPFPLRWLQRVLGYLRAARMGGSRNVAESNVMSSPDTPTSDKRH